MPLRRSALTLRQSCLLSLARNWDKICYGVDSSREMGAIIESDEYLRVEGPFIHIPSIILEDLMDVIRSTSNLTRKFLHLLLKEQLLKLNLSLGIGEIYYGLQFLPRCKRLRELNLSYLRHVEVVHILPTIPCWGALVSLNLGNSSANDLLIEKISQHCPNLLELNVESTFVTDYGLFFLCGEDSGDGVSTGCKQLQRFVTLDTRVTWIGAHKAVTNLWNLTDFDFDKIFQVFEHLDPSCLLQKSSHRTLKLRSLYSTTSSIRGESIDAVAALCPNIEILSVRNFWIDNDTFYKFMQFEHLRTLTIFNSEEKMLDYEKAIVPILMVVGENLENLILSRFTQLNILSLGRLCRNLRKLALSGISEFVTNSGSGNSVEDGIYCFLINLELWLDNDVNSASYGTLLQLLQNSLLLENLLIKNSSAFDFAFLRRIWIKNPMRCLSRLMLDHCGGIDGEAILELLQMENEISTIRVWSCPQVTESNKKRIQQFIKKSNLIVYFEWFE